jgi:glycosyltransferase involved in cell wall biosynthesis
MSTDEAASAPVAARVVFVCHTAKLGGAELSLLDICANLRGFVAVLFEDGPLAQRLRDLGGEVRVIDAPRAVMDVRRDGGVWSLLLAIPATLRLARSVVGATRRSDIICANTQKGWIICAILALFGCRTVVWFLHDILSREHFGRLQARAAVQLANWAAAAVVVNSAATADAFARLGGHRALVRLVHVGVETRPFQPLAEAERARLREAVAGRGPFVVGLFGRIARWKGQHVLLAALERLPQCRAVIVGAPLFGEQGYWMELQQQAAAPGLAGRVSFLGFRSDVPALMQAVDVVVHTSVAPEPFGRVIVEGMLARRPVIATRMGGATEILTDGESGLLVPPADAGALASAIDGLAHDPLLRERLAAAGQRVAHERFTAQRMTSEFLAVLDRAAPRAPASATVRAAAGDRRAS